MKTPERGVRRVRVGATSPASHGFHTSLSLSYHALTLWPSPAGHIFVLCICLFSCLCANICNPSGNNKVDLHMPPPILYIWCSVTYRTSFPQSPQALPITYLQYALSESPLMAVWAQACDLKAEESIQEFFLSVVLQLTGALQHHHRLPHTHGQTIAPKGAFSPPCTRCKSLVSSHSLLSTNN